MGHLAFVLPQVIFGVTQPSQTQFHCRLLSCLCFVSFPHSRRLGWSSEGDMCGSPPSHFLLADARPKQHRPCQGAPEHLALSQVFVPFPCLHTVLSTFSGGRILENHSVLAPVLFSSVDGLLKAVFAPDPFIVFFYPCESFRFLPSFEGANR